MQIIHENHYSESSITLLAGKISSAVTRGDTITLTGDLGSGKTTLVGSVIRTILNTQDLIVSSPTYQLIKIYHGPKFKIAHVDLYRIKDECELLNLGLEELLDEHTVFIEWPDIASKIIGPDALNIMMHKTSDGLRLVRCQSHNPNKWGAVK